MTVFLFVISAFISTFDPEPDSDETRKWMHFLQTVRTGQTQVALSNARLYVPQFKKIFRTEGVPEDLVWIAYIETSFTPSPTSPTGAQGIFQFKAETARAFGLRVTNRRDDRNNPELAASAAARYLKYLYKKFNNWELVLAAYNFGEGDLRRTMQRRGVSTWRKVRPFVREETQGFVGKVKAAVVIGNQFLASQNLSLKNSIYYKVRQGDNILAISRRLNLSPEALKRYNNLVSDHIYKDQILFAPRQNTQVTESYQVRKGDTLYSIARRFQTPLSSLKAQNGLIHDAISPGQILKIPQKDTDTTYIVQPGDSLTQISRKFGVTIKEIKKLNGLTNSLIYPGQRLILPSS